MDASTFDWDDANIGHIAEHDVAPDEAEEALNSDPVDLDYQVHDGEERILQIGRTGEGRILAVVSTLRDEKIRVVTAYPAILWQKRLHINLQRKKKSMIKLDTPDFKDEAEEAKWWFDHNDEMEVHFEQAAANGTLGRGSALRRLGIHKAVIQLNAKDHELASAQASERGVAYEVYLKTLVHEALERAAAQG